MKLHISSLNGLRAISIFMVIGYHLMQHNFLPNDSFIKYGSQLFFNGQMGVNIFFVISGFLITSLLMKEKTGTGSVSLNKFYCRRIIRIFPAYYFLLLIYFILEQYGYFHLDSRNWFSNLTFTKQFFHDSTYETEHLWSLSVEEVFYLIWPLMFLQLSKYYTGVLSLIILFFTVFRVFQFAYPTPHLNSSIWSTGDALLIGCLFAIHNDRIKAWVETKKKWAWLVVPALLICLIIYNYVYHLSSNPSNQVSPVSLHNLQAVAYALFGNIGLITNLLIGMLIMISINLQNTLWFRFLNLRIMELFGRLSYSLYLWQQLFTKDNPALHRIPLILLLMIILACACFSYYLIERPILKLKTRLGFKEQFQRTINIQVK